jgi:hypothetical protein
MNATEFGGQMTDAGRGSGSRAAPPAPPPGTGPQPAAVGSRPTKFLGRRLLHEIREVATASWDRPVQLARYGWGLWRRRSLSRAFSGAQLLLGQCMFAAGIDDGELGAKIAALDERIRRAGAAQALGAERGELLVQLAAAALEDDGPLPGADAEYERAREAQVALQRHDADLRAVKALLQDGLCWRRLTLGYGAVGCLAFLAIAKACGWILP